MNFMHSDLTKLLDKFPWVQAAAIAKGYLSFVTLEKITGMLRIQYKPDTNSCYLIKLHILVRNK